MKQSSFFIAAVLIYFFLVPLLTKGYAKTMIKDMTGREVTLPKRVERVVCLGPGALRLVVYLQAQNKIVGVEDMEKKQNIGRPYWLAHPELSSLPSCGPGGPASINKKPSLEKVLSLQAHLLLVTYMEKQLAEEVQKTLGIPVLAFTYGDFASFDETIYEALRLVGKALGKKERAEQVIAFIENERSRLRKRTANIEKAQKPSVYVGGIGYKGAQGLDSTDKNYAPFKWLQANCLGKEMKSPSSHLFFDKEKLLLHNPEHIFIDGGGLKIIKHEWKRKPHYYGALGAFQNNKVYTLWPINWYTTNVGTAIIDAYVIGQKTHPKRFEDIDIKKKAAQIYRYLVGNSVVEQMEQDYGALGKPF